MALAERQQAVPSVFQVRLATPPIPPVDRSIEEAAVFDAFGWCASRDLEWRHAAPLWDATTRIDGSNPARMVFVVRREAARLAAFLPREPAHVHALGLGLTDEEALAPWAIDDATDELYARRIPPRDLLWLAADNLNALFWGLHDWAHFHNHGPFEPGQRAMTELQCDAAALVWLRIARDRGDVTPSFDHAASRGRAVVQRSDAWERVRREVAALSRSRFESEGRPFDETVLSAERLQAIATRAMRS
jgi:hypothetical protein